MTKMGHKTRSNCNIYSGRSKTLAYFSSTSSISCMESIKIKSRVQGQHLLSLQLPQVSHRQLQHVSLLQLGDAFSLSLQSEDHEILEFIKTGINSSSSLPLQQRFHHLPVLIRPGHWFIFKVMFGFNDGCHFYLYSFNCLLCESQ